MALVFDVSDTLSIVRGACGECWGCAFYLEGAGVEMKAKKKKKSVQVRSRAKVKRLYKVRLGDNRPVRFQGVAR
jgi:hypothetical protein